MIPFHPVLSTPSSTSALGHTERISVVSTTASSLFFRFCGISDGSAPTEGWWWMMGTLLSNEIEVDRTVEMWKVPGISNDVFHEVRKAASLELGGCVPTGTSTQEMTGAQGIRRFQNVWRIDPSLSPELMELREWIECSTSNAAEG
ncbi:unnamed protein product, partial [Nesidiocoris tenuis]